MLIAYDVTEPVTAISWRDRNGVTETTCIEDPKSSRTLLPALASLWERWGDRPQKLGVVKGPGSFTGIRIGLATALGLRSALGIPVFGFDKFQLLGAALEEGACLVPAGPRQVYRAAIRGGRPDPPELLRIDQVSEDDRYLSSVEIVGVNTSLTHKPLTEICLDLLAKDLDPEPYDLLPLYLRPPDARKHRALLDRLLRG